MSNRKWQTGVKLSILLLLVGCIALAFVGVEPFVGVKDNVAAWLLPHIQSPIDTKMTVEDRSGYGRAYRINVDIIPTATAKLDTPYLLDVTSPYWEWNYEWDILWAEAWGFHKIQRSILITQNDPLYSHISQLEYIQLIQTYSGWPMRDIEREYQAELSKLIKIRLIR